MKYYFFSLQAKQKRLTWEVTWATTFTFRIQVSPYFICTSTKRFKLFLLQSSWTMKMKWSMYQEGGHKHAVLHTSTDTHTSPVSGFHLAGTDMTAVNMHGAAVKMSAERQSRLVSLFISLREGRCGKPGFHKRPTLWLRPLVCGKAARLLGRDRKRRRSDSVAWPVSGARRNPLTSTFSFSYSRSCHFSHHMSIMYPLLIIGHSMQVMSVLACIQEMCVWSMCLCVQHWPGVCGRCRKSWSRQVEWCNPPTLISLFF